MLSRKDLFFGCGRRMTGAGTGTGRFRRSLIALWGIFFLIIGLVKTAAFKDDAGARPDKAFEFIFATFGALGKPLFGHGLKDFHLVAAGGTFILVGRHIDPRLFECFFKFFRERIVFAFCIFAAGAGKFFQKPFLFPCQMFRHMQHDLNVLIALAAAMDIGHAFGF